MQSTRDWGLKTICAGTEWSPELGTGCENTAPRQGSLWRSWVRAPWRLATSFAAQNLLVAGGGTIQGCSAELSAPPSHLGCRAAASNGAEEA